MTLIWTREAPTEPGFYWGEYEDWQEEGRTYTILEVTDRLPFCDCWVTGSMGDVPRHVSDFVRFYGPLPVPVEDGDEL